MLLMPDLFHYWLTGEKIAEYTIASTTQMLRAHDRQWAFDLLRKFNIPTGYAAQHRAARPAWWDR